MHYRRIIREALQAQIIASATIAGANVFTGRARPILEILRKRESVVSIYTGDESSSRSADGHVYERSLTVSVELASGGGDDIDDVLDAFALQIEDAVNANPTLGNVLSSDLALESTVSEINSAGNMLIGAVRLDYAATYYTAAAEASLFVSDPVPDGFSPGAVHPAGSGAIHDGAGDPVRVPGPHAPHSPLPGVQIAPDGWTASPDLLEPAGDPVDPDPVDPDPVDPDPVDPDPVDPGPVDPGPVDPGPVDPGPVDPDPVDPDPVDPDPVDPDPVVTVTRIEAANAGAPYAASFELDALGAVSQLPNLAESPGGNTRCVAVSPDGSWLALGINTAPFIAVYRRSAGAWVRQPGPAVPVAGSVGGVAFTRDNAFLVLAHNVAPFATVYDLSAGGLDPVSLSAPVPSSGYAAAAHPADDVFFVATQGAPYIAAYRLTGGVWTRIADPATPVPSGVYGIDIALDGSIVAMSLAAAPHVAIYEFSAAGWGAKWADPGITAGSGRGIAITPDKSRVFLGHLAAPYLSGIALGSSGFAGEITVPALPGFGMSLDIDPAGDFLAVAHYGVPFLSVYDLADPALAMMPLTGRPANNGTGVTIYAAPED